jgi:hypothetical protein
VIRARVAAALRAVAARLEPPTRVADRAHAAAVADATRRGVPPRLLAAHPHLAVLAAHPAVRDDLTRRAHEIQEEAKRLGNEQAARAWERRLRADLAAYRDRQARRDRTKITDGHPTWIGTERL